MQMNLCLSGLAGCYRKVAYPAVVEEAVVRIRQTRPDAVTFNEACGNDIALIARQTLCVTTRGHIEVCTAHLSERTPMEVAGNDGQCAELTALLARRAATRTVIFGGDLNRRASCAPAGFWTRTDKSAHQDPGLQQVYGTGARAAMWARDHHIG